uniref:Uncharacterized protein n=1 Tax=Plectus sambesii TaxID=2011161 RepID=A0A914WU24_9BILA
MALSLSLLSGFSGEDGKRDSGNDVGGFGGGKWLASPSRPIGHSVAALSPSEARIAGGKGGEGEGDRCHRLARVRRAENDIIMSGQELRPALEFLAQKTSNNPARNGANRRAALCPTGEAASVRESGERKETLSPTTTATTTTTHTLHKKRRLRRREKLRCDNSPPVQIPLSIQVSALDDEHYWRPDVAVAVFNIRDIMSTVTLNPSCCFAY